MVLVGLMLQCWRRISIVSILFNVWHQNGNWTKEVFFCSPKIIHGCTHAEYISSRSCNGLLLNQCTQVIDLCSWVTPVSQPVNSEASVMEALVACSNIMSYRTDVRYLVFYIASFQKWESNNNFLNHYRQQPPVHANLH